MGPGRARARCTTGVLGLAVAAALVGCGPSQPSPELTSSTADSAPPTATEAPSPTPWDTDPYEPITQVEPTPTTQELAQVAEGFVRTYGASYDDHQQWWASVEPLLTAQAAATYATVDFDALMMTDLTLTEQVSVHEQDSPFVAVVDVPTASGTLRVVLSCASQGQPWLVESIT